MDNDEFGSIQQQGIGDSSSLLSLPVLSPNNDVPMWYWWSNAENCMPGSSFSQIDAYDMQQSVEDQAQPDTPPPVLTRNLNSEAPAWSWWPDIASGMREGIPLQSTKVTQTKSGDKKATKGKSLTTSRRKILLTFLNDVVTRTHKFGEIGGEEWTLELIKRLRKFNGSTGNVSHTDVLQWLETPEFVEIIGQIKDISSPPINVLLEEKSQSSVVATTSKCAPQWQVKEYDKVEVQVTERKICPIEINTNNAGMDIMLSTEMQESVHDFTSSASMVESAHTSNAVTVNYEQECPEPEHISLSSQHPLTDLFESLSSMEYETMDEPIDNGTQQQQEEPKIQTSAGVEVYVQSSGFIIGVPASSTETILLVKPVSWSAFKHHPGSENEANTTSSSWTTVNTEMNSDC